MKKVIICIIVVLLIAGITGGSIMLARHFNKGDDTVVEQPQTEDKLADENKPADTDKPGDTDKPIDGNKPSDGDTSIDSNPTVPEVKPEPKPVFQNAVLKSGSKVSKMYYNPQNTVTPEQLTEFYKKYNTTSNNDFRFVSVCNSDQLAMNNNQTDITILGSGKHLFQFTMYQKYSVVEYTISNSYGKLNADQTALEKFHYKEVSYNNEQDTIFVKESANVMGSLVNSDYCFDLGEEGTVCGDATILADLAKMNIVSQEPFYKIVEEGEVTPSEPEVKPEVKPSLQKAVLSDQGFGSKAYINSNFRMNETIYNEFWQNVPDTTTDGEFLIICIPEDEISSLRETNKPTSDSFWRNGSGNVTFDAHNYFVCSLDQDGLILYSYLAGIGIENEHSIGFTKNGKISYSGHLDSQMQPCYDFNFGEKKFTTYINPKYKDLLLKYNIVSEQPFIQVADATVA